MWSPDLGGSLLGTRAAIEIALIGNLLVSYIDKEDKLNYLMTCFVIAGLILVFKMLIIVPINDWGTQRIGNKIYNANAIGLYLGFATIFAAYLSMLKKQKHYYVIMCMFFLVILATGSRKAFLLVLLGIAALNIIKSDKVWKRLIAIPISTFIIILGYQLIMNVPTLYNIIGSRIERLIYMFTGLGNVDASTRIRLGMIETGISLFKLRPFSGHGINSFTIISGYDTYSHNNYIELLVGVGLIGTLIYYSIYAHIIIKLAKNRRNRIASVFLIVITLLTIIEYGLVSWEGELYQILIAAAFSTIKLVNIKKNINLNKGRNGLYETTRASI
jgi:O-antigen ligase